MDDRFILGGWPPKASCEGVNWQELWAVERALNTSCDLVRDKLVLVRMVDSTAAAYADYGPVCPPALTAVARGIK